MKNGDLKRFYAQSKAKPNDFVRLDKTGKVPEDLIPESSKPFLVVEPVTSSIDLFGKTASDLQSDIQVTKDGITGTLKHVTDYTGFSGDPEEQSGNYIALKATSVSGASITGEIVVGTSGPVTLDSDGIIVIRVKNTSQKIYFTATVDNVTITKEYVLTNLILNS